MHFHCSAKNVKNRLFLLGVTCCRLWCHMAGTLIKTVLVVILGWLTPVRVSLRVGMQKIAEKQNRSYPLFTFLDIWSKWGFCTCQATAFYQFEPCINSLWPGDAIWQHRSASALAQVMACCLTAPSHYLNQCWLFLRFCDIHLQANSQQVHKLLFCIMGLKIIL